MGICLALEIAHEKPENIPEINKEKYNQGEAENKTVHCIMGKP